MRPVPWVRRWIVAQRGQLVDCNGLTRQLAVENSLADAYLLRGVGVGDDDRLLRHEVVLRLFLFANSLRLHLQSMDEKNLDSYYQGHT